jgi:hypothetical protein
LSTETQQSNAGIGWVALKGLLELFVTPLSLIAAMFLSTAHVCTYLYSLLTKDNCTSTIYAVGIYVSLGILALSALIVLLLTIFSPDNLIYDKGASLQKRGIPPYGQDGQIQKSKKSKPTTPPKQTNP